MDGFEEWDRFYEAFQRAKSADSGWSRYKAKRKRQAAKEFAQRMAAGKARKKAMASKA